MRTVDEAAFLSSNQEIRNREIILPARTRGPRPSGAALRNPAARKSLACTRRTGARNT